MKQYSTEENEAGGIQLGEFFSALWEGKLAIVAITSSVVVMAVLYALWLPNIYESKAVLSPEGEDGPGGLAGLARQYGGLASLAGINIGTTNTEATKSLIAQAQIKSLVFFTKHLYEKILPDLMAVERWDSATGDLVYDPEIFSFETQSWVRDVGPPYKTKPSAQEAHRIFLADVLSVAEAKKTGFVTISVKHESPLVARDWVELIIESVTRQIRSDDIQEAEQSIIFLNEQRAQTALVTLDEVFAQLVEEQTKKIMLANVSKNYVFDVIEPPVASELKYSPKRALICVLGGVIGGLMALTFVLARYFLGNNSQP